MAAKPHRREYWVASDFTVTLSGEPDYEPTHAEVSPQGAERSRELIRRHLDGEDVTAEAHALALAEGVAAPAGHVAETVAPSTRGARRLRGARIADAAAGVVYECVAERRYGVPVLVYLAIIPTRSGAITRDHRDALSLDDLARVTLAHVEAKKQTTVSAAPKRRQVWPGHAAVADAARQAQAAGGSPRQHLAATYSISPSAADKWLRRARDAGALPEPPREHGGKPRTNHRKDQS